MAGEKSAACAVILQRLDFEALSRAFGQWSGQYVDWSGQWLSVEGKSLRSTVSGHDSAEQHLVVLVSAFCQPHGAGAAGRAAGEGQKQRDCPLSAS